MTRWKRIASVGAGAAAWWLVSCRDIPAPSGSVMALSPVLLPLPGLVVGDTMRDSTGLVAPLRLIAYGVNGEPLSPQPAVTFIALDTTAHVSGALLIGDRAGGTARVVGSVAGLQSQIATVKVTESPDLIVAADSVLHRKTYSTVSDTIAVSPELSVLVQHAGTTTTGVEAVIVRYAIDRAPGGNGNGPTVVLAHGPALSSRDTTDGSGKASRTARLRLVALTGFATDTVQVSATASHRGTSLGTVTFTIIYTKQ